MWSSHAVLAPSHPAALSPSTWSRWLTAWPPGSPPSPPPTHTHTHTLVQFTCHPSGVGSQNPAAELQTPEADP